MSADDIFNEIKNILFNRSELVTLGTKNDIFPVLQIGDVSLYSQDTNLFFISYEDIIVECSAAQSRSIESRFAEIVDIRRAEAKAKKIDRLFKRIIELKENKKMILGSKI